MPGSLWTVVKFIGEDSVEAVPTKWILNGKCYWPPFQLNKLKTAIQKNEDPNTNWPSYEVSIFRNSTFDNYSKAREKCKKAEYTSDLNSDTGEGIKKRVIKKRRISSSEEENYESDCRSLIPTPPLLKDNCEATADIARSKTISKQISIPAEHCEATADIARSKTISKQVSIPAEESSEFNLLCTTPSRIRSELKRRKQVDAQQDSPNNNISFNNNNNINPNKENEDLSANFRDRTCSFRPAHVETQNQNEAYFKEIIRQLGYIKTQLWQTNDDIQDIKRNGIIRSSTPTDISRNESLFYSFTLPLQTEDQLQEAETFLKNTANMTTTVKQALRIGGKDCYDFIKRSLNQLLSNRLAEKYSLLGKKQKLAFRNLKLAELLIAAGEAHSEAFSKKDVEQAIQKWLRRAKERADAEEKKIQEER